MKERKAVTLIETIIAVGIFSLVITITTGIIVSSLAVQGSSLGLKRIQEEGRFLMEFMQKEARQAGRSTGGNCLFVPDGSVYFVSSDGQELRFKNSNEQCVVYKFTAGLLKRSNDEGLSFDNFSSPDLAVTGSFALSGTTNPLLSYDLLLKKARASLNLKSSVSARVY